MEILELLSVVVLPILGALWYITKLFIKHKLESDEWKREHSERLATLEGKLEILVKEKEG